MRILQAHNFYGDYVAGGEGSVLTEEAGLLRSHGHEVRLFEKTNASVLGSGLFNVIGAVSHIYHSPKSQAEIGAVMDEFRPDVLHVHNYMLALTPSIFLAARERKIATVLTLHNFRLLCPTGQFLRNGRVCESCFQGGGYWRPILTRCYPGGSLSKTVAAVHLHRQTKKDKLLSDRVDAYIALTQYGLEKFVVGGIPADQMHLKPNFLDDPFTAAPPPPPGHGAVCVGRLTTEKGVDVLLRAWKDIHYPLTIVGDGPEKDSLQKMAPPQVSFTGYVSEAEKLDHIQRSAFTVFPSLWYEGLPMVLLEMLRCGRAVIATDLGARKEIVTPDVGLLYAAASSESLAAAVKTLIADPLTCKRMGANARRLFIDRYTSESNYQTLMSIYGAAVARARSSGRPLETTLST